MQERLPSVMELSEAMEELRALMQSVERLMARDRVRRYGGGPGALTLIDWSHLQSAVVSLRGLNAGRPCSDGDGFVARSVGGRTTSQF